jgi:hypothetical protein
MSDLPHGSLKAGAEAIGGDRKTAEVVLRAALPHIERDVRRQMARLMKNRAFDLDLDLYGTFYSWQRLLNHAARTGLLPPAAEPVDTEADR